MHRKDQSLADLFFSFEGRINRAKFWLYYVLVLNTVYLAFYGFGGLLGGEQGFVMGSVVGTLAILWPALALSVKRCHDRNRSWLFILVSLVPLVNLWYAVEVLFLKGTDGTNDYGPDPLRSDIPSMPIPETRQERKPAAIA